MNLRDYLGLPLATKRAVAAALAERQAKLAAPEEPADGAAPLETAHSAQPKAATGEGATEGGTAIIGMSGRFPGSCDLESFWKNLAEARDLITATPPGRWPGAEIPVEATHGGFIDDVDAFDAAFFGISESEAVLMDPHQRLFLETCWSALEDAGYPPGKSGSARVGLFVGMYSYDFNQLLGVEVPRGEGLRLTGRLNVMVANRVSHLLNLRGPSELVDTACSSSLVAIHRAVQALAAGDCDIAIAGGISLLLSPASTRWLGQVELLSKSGQFRPFDLRADGLVRGEGSGAVVLKPLTRAVADGDSIRAVVRASAVNHNGRDGGALTTPNANAQANAIIEAYRKGMVGPGTIDYIEAHGAASDLGDFVEVNAYKQAFAQLDPTLTRGSCGIGTLKANIGALDAAGGIAGAIKVVLAMKHRQWPATINYGEIRPDLNLGESPFYVVGKAEPWLSRAGQAAPLRAAVHAYGLGGVNAHIVLEDHGPEGGAQLRAEVPDGSVCAKQHLFPFSACDSDRLREVVGRFVDWLDRGDGSLADAAFTLRAGRAEHRERLAVVAATRDELRAALSDFLGGRACEGLWTGSSEAGDAVNGSPGTPEDISGYARAWVAGAEFPDSSEFPKRGHRISLPTYPFLRRRFRLPALSSNSVSQLKHQFLDTFQPCLGGARFTKRFSPADLIVAEHRYLGSPLVPAVCLCEMVRAAAEAVELSGFRGIDSIIFLRPLFVTEPGVTVMVELEAGDRVGKFEITAEGSHERRVHCRGGFAWNPLGGDLEPENLDFAAALARCPAEIGKEELYSELARLQLDYGLSFRNLERVSFNEREAIGRFSVDASTEHDQRSQVLRPGVFDVLLQMSAVFGLKSAARASLPLSIDGIELNGPLPPDGWVYIQRERLEGEGGVSRFHGAITDAAGRVVLKLRNLCVKEPATDSLAGSEPVPISDRVSVEEEETTDPGRRFDTKQKIRAEQSASSSPLLAGTLAETPPVQRDLASIETVTERDQMLALTAAWLEATFARRLRRTGKIDSESNFERFGVDSVTTLEILDKLELTFGFLPKTLLFEFNSLSKLARYFVDNHRDTLKRSLAINGRSVASDGASLFGGTAPAARGQPSAPTIASEALAPDQIAIIGLGLRFPGAASPDEFWANLAGAKSSITEVPAKRWDHRQFPLPGGLAGKNPKWGGFIEDVDKFDAAFFGISPKEAEQMDPQERLFLEVVWETLEDAGYTREKFAKASGNSSSGGNVGVFVGVMYGGYQLYGTEEIDEDSPGPISPYWSVANRISYFCDFHGPSLAVDTACAASLTAVHLACESLRRGECQAALAGGVTLMVHPRQFLTLASMKMLSRDDSCRAFGEGADGFVPGEGAGSVLLKPLADAIRAGDRIYGVIKGSSINAGGKTSGYTVPDPVSQGNVIAAAWKRASIEPGSISCIEAHGTGTALGDPIEIRGLDRAFGSAGGKVGFCALGSVKSNIGHLQAAAGIASLAKVLLQFQHGQLAPTLNAVPANPYIDFASSPFFLVKSLQTWERPIRDGALGGALTPRRAGLSSFGVGGANAHVIVEQWETAPLARIDDGEPHLIPLSARNVGALRNYAVKFKVWLEGRSKGEISLGDLAYSWQTGREAMEERLVFVARSLSDVSGKLQAYIDGRMEAEMFVSVGLDASHPVLGSLGGILAGTGLVAELIRRREWANLAALWVAGFNLDWALLHEGNERRRISLPTYPFAKKSFWAQTRGELGKPPRMSVTLPLKPEPLPANHHGSGGSVPGSHEIRSFLIVQVAEALKMPVEDVEVRKAFSEFGVDSLIGSRISKMLGTRLGIEVSATLLWEYPTIDSIASHLAERVRKAGDPVRLPTIPETAPQAGDNILERISEISEAEIDGLLASLLPSGGESAANESKGNPDEIALNEPEQLLRRLQGLSPEASSDYFNRLFESS